MFNVHPEPFLNNNLFYSHGTTQPTSKARGGRSQGLEHQESEGLWNLYVTVRPAPNQRQDLRYVKNGNRILVCLLIAKESILHMQNWTRNKRSTVYYLCSSVRPALAISTRWLMVWNMILIITCLTFVSFRKI